MPEPKSKRFHVVLSRPFDLDAFDAEAAADRSPRHTMSLLRHALQAELHAPDDAAAGAADKLAAKTIGVATPGHWVLGREAKERFATDDTIFAIGEDGGIPIARAFKSGPRPRLAVFMQHPGGKRAQLAFKLFGLRDRFDLYVTNTAFKGALLEDVYGIPKDRIYVAQEQTDTKFFRPEDMGEKPRPVIGSGGLEQRDYVTLGAATADLDVDVRICAMSPNATSKRDTFPDPLPANMEVGRYEWPELRDLYNRSDIVVLSMKHNVMQAGLTTLMEALACRRPVVMTRTEGLASAFADAGLITPVPPNDPEAMKAAISGLLADPEAAAAQAERGYKAVLEHHTAERYVGELERLLSGL